MIISNPQISEAHRPITDDIVKDDMKACLRRFNEIRISPNSQGKIKIYIVDFSLIFSFTHFIDEKQSKEIGILELGADLTPSEKLSIICTDGQLLNKLKKTYSKITKNRIPTVNL